VPRSLWSGSLSFGLVNVPVALLSAVTDQDVHFRQLHAKDNALLETRYFCAEEDKEIPYEAIGHAYDLDGQDVVLTDDELSAIAPERTRTIEIESFVDREELDPVLFDHPYWLVPTGEAEGPRRAYRLLVETMSRTDRVALGRFVFRTRERLCAVRVRDGVLDLTTLRFAEELRAIKAMAPGGSKPKKAELDHAVKLLDALTVEWDPSAYQDEYTKRLRKVVRDKAKGATIEVPDQQEEPEPTGDLMAALRATMEDLGAKA
jgi:DNA end-binding protein Ku